MANCKICEIIESDKFLYKDDKVIVYLDEAPSAPGHIVIAPIRHHPIIEEVPDYVVDQMFQVANKMSIIMFEVFKAQGTNVIVNNGTEAGQEQPHVTVNIIPRRENDGLRREQRLKKDRWQ